MASTRPEVPSSATAAAAAGLPIVVVGAGLAGATMALLLAQRGYRVELYEKRADPRIAERAEASRLA